MLERLFLLRKFVWIYSKFGQITPLWMTHPTVMPDLIGHLCRRSFASAQDDRSPVKQGMTIPVIQSVLLSS